MKKEGAAATASRTQFATDEIAKAIFSGAFRPGQQLTEEDLARRFNVSRIPIREALRELSREGLIRLLPRRGAFVARMDHAEAAEMYDVRAALEAFAARLCARHIPAKALAELQDVLLQMRDAAANNEVDRYSRLSTEFRRVIWENTPNRVLRELIRQLWRRSLKLRFIAMRLPGRLEDSLAGHEQLFEAIKTHDSQAAEMVRWLGVQRAKRALLSGYFSEAVRPERRSQLEQNLPDLDSAALRLEQPQSAVPR